MNRLLPELQCRDLGVFRWSGVLLCWGEGVLLCWWTRGQVCNVQMFRCVVLQACRRLEVPVVDEVAQVSASVL